MRREPPDFRNGVIITRRVNQVLGTNLTMEEVEDMPQVDIDRILAVGEIELG